MCVHLDIPSVYTQSHTPLKSHIIGGCLCKARIRPPSRSLPSAVFVNVFAGRVLTKVSLSMAVIGKALRDFPVCCQRQSENNLFLGPFKVGVIQNEAEVWFASEYICYLPYARFGDIAFTNWMKGEVFAVGCGCLWACSREPPSWEWVCRASG